jgi:hypothetical protein
MGLVAVQMSINPFEFYLLVAVCIVGVLYLIGLPPPNSVAMLLPAPMVKLWAVNLGVGGLSAFIGGLWRRNLSHGLLAYQVGWVLVGVACLTYGLALLLLFPTTGGVYAGISNVPPGSCRCSDSSSSASRPSPILEVSAVMCHEQRPVRSREHRRMGTDRLDTAGK